MNTVLSKILLGISLVILGIIWHGVSTMPTDIQKEHNIKIKADLLKLPVKINTAETSLKHTKIYKQMNKIYKSENLDSVFNLARNEYKKLYNDSISLDTLIQNNNFWSKSDVEIKIATIEKQITKVQADIRTPIRELIKIKHMIDGLIKDNVKDNHVKDITRLNKHLQNTVTRQSKKYPTCQKTMNSELADIEKKLNVFLNNYKILKSLLNEKYDMDYIKFKKVKLLFDNDYRSLDALLNKTIEKNKSLDKSYSKILIDMKAQFKISLSYSMWDEYAEWDNTATGSTKMEIVPAHIYFAVTDVQDLVFKCTSSTVFSKGGCMDYTNENSKKYFNLYMPKWYNRKEYWVNTTSERYSHKYKIEENGKIRITDWIDVSSDYYWNNVNHKGMSVETKPIGTFNTNTVTTAIPPGLAYVGNQSYGHYNDSGSWVFLPMFYNNYGSYNYGRADYDDYSNYKRTSSKIKNKNNASSGYYGRSNRNIGRTSTKGVNSKLMTRTSHTFGSNGRGRGAGGGGK